MAWLFLLLAGVCEMAWPIGFKFTNGFRSHYGIVALTMAAMLLSFVLMGMAVNRGIHVGTAYAVWTGIGATGTAALGMYLYKEPHDVPRLACLGLVIVGVIGLKLFSPPPAQAQEASQAGATTAESVTKPT